MWEAPGNEKPIIDLQPLLELPEWFHAVRVFRDHGTTAPIAELFRPLTGPLGEILKQKADRSRETATSPQEASGLHKQATQVGKVPKLLEKYAFAYESALPLELGKVSQELIEPIGHLARNDFTGRPPLAEALTDALTGAAKNLALERRSRKGKWKTNVALNNTELQRQVKMINLYLEREQYPLAVGLMREWVVSWVILKSGESGAIKDWLRRDTRLRCERRLGALGAFVRSTGATDRKLLEFGDFWNNLANDLRNPLHHHAMREDSLEEPPAVLQRVRCFWNQLSSDEIDPPQLGGGNGRLLLSPQGTKPGVLFSALHVAKPDICLVVCSGASANSIKDATQQAEFGGLCEHIQLEDPHGGFGEIGAAVAAAPGLAAEDRRRGGQHDRRHNIDGLDCTTVGRRSPAVGPSGTAFCSY